MVDMRSIIRSFEKGNVCVCGMMGTGKDVLFGNVINRIKRPYISNLDYGGQRIKFKPWMLNFNNTWRNLMEDHINRFEYIFPDRFHFYMSDLGIYMPSQNQSELCKEYPYIPTSMPMMRQVAGAWFHANCQVPNRIWDKAREHFDIWYRCIFCKVLFGKIVIQYLIEYDKYQSVVDRVPPFPLRRPLLNKDRQQLYDIQKSNYLISHGKVKPKFLIYWNRSKHNTRGFKEMFENA